MRECNANHPFLLPVRPIAKSFCEVWQLIPYSRISSTALFTLCCGLLFASYEISAHLNEMAKELLLGGIENQIIRKVVAALSAWVIQLFVSNSSFFVFRIILAGLVYAIYELGRDVVFSILIFFLVIVACVCVAEFYYSRTELDEFISSHRFELVSAFAVFTATVWYWRRYIFRNRENQAVFDHDVGAALARLRS